MSTHTMHNFRQELFQSASQPDPLMKDLAQVTRASLDKMVAFKSDLQWIPWDAANRHLLTA